MLNYYFFDGVGVAKDPQDADFKKWILMNSHLEGRACTQSEYEAHLLEGAKKAKSEENRKHLFALVDKIANWLATENEFGVPPDLKSAVMAWQARKPRGK